MDKIAIHVPNEYLSEAVQKYLFDKGYGWYRYRLTEVKSTYGKTIYLEGMSIWIDVSDVETYTVLTVDEFFKKEVGTLNIQLGGSTCQIKGSASGLRYGFVIEGSGLMTWEDYDKIGTLRPKANHETTPDEKAELLK